MPSGNISPGGTKIQARAAHIMNWQPSIAAVGTTGGGLDTAMTASNRYTSIYIPGDVLITNIEYKVGGTVGTNKAVAVLYDESGTPLASSAVAGTVTAGASTFNVLALTAPYMAQGPGLFFVGIIFDGATDTYAAVDDKVHAGIFAGTSTQAALPASFAAIPALTISATRFTAAKAPVVRFT